MDFQRILPLAAFALICLLLWDAWKQYHAPPPVAPGAAVAADVATETYRESSPDVPQAPIASADVPSATGGTDIPQPEQVTNIPATRIIQAETDTLIVDIDTLGGDVVGVRLKQYPVSVNEPNVPFTLLESDNQREYIAQSGLIGQDGPDANPDGRPQYHVEQKRFLLSEYEDCLQVPLYWEDGNGVSVTKIFTLPRGTSVMTVDYKIENNSSELWSSRMYGQLKRDNSSDPSSMEGMFAMRSYLGPAYSTQDTPYKKYKFGDMVKANLQNETVGGWVAMLQHYFISAWVPNADDINNLYTSTLPGPLYVIGFWGPGVHVYPGEQKQVSAQLYAGPKVQKELKEVAENLNLTVDYGFLFFLAQPLFWLLDAIHSVVKNWGWAIIFLTLLIKLAFYKLSATSYRSMARMRQLQPRVLSLKERYGDDRQGMSRAMMDLYKKEKINPLGGCLPILIQIPVFIALYWVLLESVELRQAPFMLWIKDLSLRDPYFILPVLMGLSMFVQQRLNPTPPDPMQAKIMAFLPFLFTIFFLFFPAGLVLYWVVNNLLSILQQWYITKKIEQQPKHKAKK